MLTVSGYDLFEKKYFTDYCFFQALFAYKFVVHFILFFLINLSA